MLSFIVAILKLKFGRKKQIYSEKIWHFDEVGHVTHANLNESH